MEIEDMNAVCHRNRTNVDLLYNDSGDLDKAHGIRLRFYGDPDLKDKMVLASGPTVADALYAALMKAKARNFQKLDFKARPWGIETNNGGFNW